MTCKFNLISEEFIRATLVSGSTQRFSLSGLLAALMRDEIAAFPALRPHQRHAWHAFLAQVGALALLAAGRPEPAEKVEEWAQLLRNLAPDQLDDAPWRLVSPLTRPAFLQPPVPNGKDLKHTADTPDALDMLVTAKNHDLKQQVMDSAALDDWLFALVTLQTMEGFLGAGNYGISRMNGGFANRSALGIAPPGGPGAHLRRDIRRLIELREQIPAHAGFPSSGGLATDRRAQHYLAHFDQLVDRTFFPDLWEEFEPDDADARRRARSRWVQRILKTAEGLLHEANESASKAVGRRYRSWARAESLFHGAARKNEHISPHLSSRPQESASVAAT
jgi:hypothetical protein